jgi:hypothetical protein
VRLATRLTHSLRTAVGIAVLGTLAGVSGPASAQAELPDPAESRVAPGSELRVFLLTMGQGDAVWEYFGHNALVIRNDATGQSIAYNWGIFDNTEPGFLRRFLRGRMEYWMDAYDTDATVRAYAARDRSVWSQELNLTSVQKSALQEFVIWNARPENRRYTYDYFRDNCSTRVRDALDQALGGHLGDVLRTRSGERTYRSEAVRLTAADVPIATGIDIGLGPRTDEPLTAWEESFVPMRLRDHIRDITVAGPDGGPVPLVIEETVLYESTRVPPPDVAPRRLLASLVVGMVLAVLFALLAQLGERRGRGLALLFGLTVAVWALLHGVLGVILAGLWLFTDHVAAWRNENLLQTSPVALVLVPLVVMAVLGHARARELAGVVAVLLAGMSVLGLMLSPLPFFDQANARVIAIVLPAHLVLAWVLLRWSPGSTSTFGDTDDWAWRARAARAAGRHR